MVNLYRIPDWEVGNNLVAVKQRKTSWEEKEDYEQIEVWAEDENSAKGQKSRSELWSNKSWMILPALKFHG